MFSSIHIKKFAQRVILPVLIGICLSGQVYATTQESNVIESQSTVSSKKIKTIDKIEVFVNKGVITSNQVNTTIKLLQSSYRQKGMQVPNPTDLRNNVINQMITLQVELDIAKRAGIQATDIEVNNAINGIVKSSGMSMEQFKAGLVAQGVSLDDLRQQAADQITAEKLKQREVDGRIVISDDEVNRILNSEAYKKRVDYDLSYIIVNVPEQASQQVILSKKKLVDDAYQALKNGRSFTDVSAHYSNAPNALEGGVLGWRSNVALPTVISNSLQGQSSGYYTSVLQLPVGFVIFKINGVRGVGTPQIVKQYNVSHILIKVNENNSDDEARRKIDMIEATLQKYKSDPKELKAEFIKLAKQYSEDTSSINGGDIGWVGKGDTVPTFESMVINTPVGTVSQPVRTPFGWHILMVNATRDSDQTTDREKATIRQELREVKATLMYVEWIRNIRDSAYVKMNEN